MPGIADLEISLHKHDDSSYAVELRFSQPDSDTDVRLAQASPAFASFDLEKLDEQIAALDMKSYGKLLSESLFADANARLAFEQARASAQSLDVPMRVRLLIGATAASLHTLRWETLRDPQDGSLLAANQNILFSRYLASMDWRPVRLKAKGDLKALIAVATPNGLEKAGFGVIDKIREVDLAKSGLGEIPARVIDRASLTSIIQALRGDVYDVLYLVCHGKLLKDEPTLWLEDDRGGIARTAGSEFAARIKELETRPRLIVMASCQSAGSEDGAALSGTGPRLSEAGVPAVIAMQGNVQMATAAKLMPHFFKELLRDGSIDRALAVARGDARDLPDAWMPALFMRLKSGRLWYTPGFGGPTGKFEKWPALINAIQSGKCTPIIGPGINDALIGSMRDLAQHWADDLHYPLAPHDRESLPQVAQFRSIDQDRFTAEAEWSDQMRKAIGRKIALSKPDAALAPMIVEAGSIVRQNDEYDPHNILARMPARVYITANTDELLEDALREAGRAPQTMMCPWREFGETDPAMYARSDAFDPTPEKPLVYHLFGLLSQPESLVLTEDDSFQFLIGITRHIKNIPDQVGRALTDSSLLFLGFQTDDWNFRVLLHALLAKEGNALLKRRAHIAAQIEPDETRLIDPSRARRYLEHYFAKGSEIEINIYWGSAREFSKELASRLPQT
jgi:hypothetical protein